MFPTPLRRALIPVIFVLGLSVLRAEPVNRTPPGVYAEQIAALLTPIDQVLAGRDAFPKADSHGTVLLDEVVLFRDAAGVDYRLYHDVRLAHDDSAAETMGNFIFTFDREHESISLISASTLRPDGTRQELDDRAAFIQSPQHEAENGLYTSNLELNLIFPKILPGAITESIVIIRVDKPVFPGEFVHRVIFSSGWPTFRERVILDLPAADMARLHLIAPAEIPEPQVSEPAAGRIRKIWQRERTARLDWEESGPPMEFRAPTLWMTTLDSWDQVAGWFDDLVKDRSTIGPDLEKEIETWTAGLTEPRQIVDKLCAVVANDVRYTGLEFGLAGYQPYPCAQVWANRYGDCKDKANLLRALLAHKGIRSHLVLLSTERLGRVEQRSPSWKQFTHCILAVENPDGSLLFCDPTIKHLAAGHIGRNDSARPVLVVRDRRAVWVQTPDVLADEILYGAEAALTASGELSGWFSIRAKAGDAAAYADYYNDMDASERSRNLQRVLEGFFPGAQVVDVDYHAHTGTVQDFQIRAYFLRKPSSAKLDTLAFPYTPAWLPTVSTTQNRLFPYATTRRREGLDMTIVLPDGWIARQVPAAFEANSSSSRFSAAWKNDGNRLNASFQWQPEAAELSPADYAVFQRSVRALRSWMEQPAHLASSGTAAPAAAPKAALENFPPLATGEGQLRLLAQRFPWSDDNTKRRAALEQVLQWFPDDIPTCFEAKVFLALIDGKDDDALLARTIQEHIARYEDRITPESRGWARYLEARARWWAASEPAAIKDLQSLAADKALSSFRRTWSAYYAGSFISEKDPAAALAFLQEFHTQPEEARDDILNLEVRLLHRLADPARTKAWAEQLTGLPATDADALLAGAFATLIDKRSETPEAAYAHFDQVLTPLLQPRLATLPKTAERLKQIQSIGESHRQRAQFNQVLAQWLKANPRPWLTLEKSPAFKNTTALIDHLKEMNDSSQGKAVIDGCFQLLRFHDTNYATYQKYLYWSFWWLHHDHLEPELFTQLAEASYRLPTTDSNDLQEAWLHYAQDLRDRKNIPAARSLYHKIMADASARPYQRFEAGGELATLELEQGDIPASLAASEAVFKEHTAHTGAAEYLFRDLILQLELKHFDEALALLQAIDKIDPKYRDKTKYADCLKYLLPLAAKPDELIAYWRRQEKWLPAWQALLRKHGVTPPPIHQVPLIADINETQQQMEAFATAKDSKKFLRNLDLFVHSGAWMPLFTSNVCKLSIKAGSISAQLQSDLYTFGLAVVTDFPAVDEAAQRNARLWQASFLIDLNRGAEARPVARRLYEEFGAGHSTGGTGLRLWLLATPGSDEQAEAIAAATRLLSSGQRVDNRPEVVATLSDALFNLRSVDANITLLARELTHPDVAAHATMKQKLTDRLEFLRKDSNSGAEFTAQIRGWLKERRLEWLQSVPPLTLDQPRYANPTDDGIFGNSPLSFYEENIGNLRLALDEQKPVNVRHRAFRNAALCFSFLETEGNDYADYYVSVLRLKSLPDQMRSDILVNRAAFLIKYGHTAAAGKLFNAEPDAVRREKLVKIHAAGIAAVKAMADYKRPKIAEAAQTLLGEPIGDFEKNLLSALFSAMVRHGDADLATSLVEGAAALKAAPGTSQSPNGIKLDWTRRIRRESAQAPLLAEIRSILAKYCKPTPADAKDFRRLSWPISLKSLPHKTRARVIAAYFTENIHTADEPVMVYSYLTTASAFIGQVPDLGPELHAAILAAGIDDQARAGWLQATSPLLDFDTPSVRESFTRQCDEFLARTDPSSSAQTRRILRMETAVLTLRVGTEPRPDALFGRAVESDLGKQAVQPMQFIYLASREQTAAALSFLESLDADVLSEASLYPYVHRLLDAPDRESERRLLAASAREKLSTLLPTLWLDSNPRYLAHVADVARLVGAGDLMSDALFDRALSIHNDEFDRSFIRLARASLHQDWAAQLKAAQAVLDRLDDYYVAYFYRGQARLHLGDKAGARSDLELFASKALEDYHLPEARRLLSTLATP